MIVAGTSLRAIVVGSVVTTTTGVNQPCPTGTRVHSLSVWSGHWLDGLFMRCTGDSGELAIPPEFNEEPGGHEEGSICAGTAGVQSMEWHTPTAIDNVMAYVNITCLDDETYQLADSKSYDDWGGMDGSQTASCDEGEYVKGLTYVIEYMEETDDYPYYMSAIGFMCSSSTLDPICTACSGDTTLRSDEDQPEYCELPSCTEEECCEATESEGMTDDIITGVVATVIAAMIVSGSAWAYKKFKNDGGSEGGGVEDLRAPTV